MRHDNPGIPDVVDFQSPARYGTTLTQTTTQHFRSVILQDLLAVVVGVFLRDTCKLPSNPDEMTAGYQPGFPARAIELTVTIGIRSGKNFAAGNKFPASCQLSCHQRTTINTDSITITLEQE